MSNVLLHAYRLVQNATRDRGVSKRRSPMWPHARKMYLLKQPTCEACGSRDHLDVHHRVPYHLNPELELDPSNFIALCMSTGNHCHLLLGHGKLFKAFCVNVQDYAKRAMDAHNATDEDKLIALYYEAEQNRKLSL